MRLRRVALTGGPGRACPGHQMTTTACQGPCAGVVPDASLGLHPDWCLRRLMLGSTPSVPSGFPNPPRQTRFMLCLTDSLLSAGITPLPGLQERRVATPERTYQPAGLGAGAMQFQRPSATAPSGRSTAHWGALTNGSWKKILTKLDKNSK